MKESSKNEECILKKKEDKRKDKEKEIEMKRRIFELIGPFTEF